jgi:flagellar motor switch protein FliN/FliY
LTSALPGGSESTAAGVGKDAMGLLMEMEMPLLVRFGSTRMLLSDILALGAGSVVEFRRTPDEPVDLIVNGRVVARAQVVVVQGNYGVRILEIVSQQEDLVSDAQPAARTVRGDN